MYRCIARSRQTFWRSFWRTAVTSVGLARLDVVKVERAINGVAEINLLARHSV